MTKKEISNLLRKYFGYPPTAHEIVFYELKEYPKKEKEFNAEEKEETFLELQRQFPDQYKDKPKRPKTVHVWMPDTIRKEIIEKPIEEPETGIQRVQRMRIEESREYSFKSAKERAVEIKAWHMENKIPIPREMQQLFAKYDIN